MVRFILCVLCVLMMALVAGAESEPFNHSTIQLFNSYTNHAGNVASGVKDIKIGIRAYSRSGN